MLYHCNKINLRTVMPEVCLVFFFYLDVIWCRDSLDQLEFMERHNLFTMVRFKWSLPTHFTPICVVLAQVYPQFNPF